LSRGKRNAHALVLGANSRERRHVQFPERRVNRYQGPRCGRLGKKTGPRWKKKRSKERGKLPATNRTNKWGQGIRKTLCGEKRTRSACAAAGQWGKRSRASGKTYSRAGLGLYIFLAYGGSSLRADGGGFDKKMGHLDKSHRAQHRTHKDASRREREGEAASESESWLDENTLSKISKGRAHRKIRKANERHERRRPKKKSERRIWYLSASANPKKHRFAR